MTWFGIVLIVFYSVGIAAKLFYIGRNEEVIIDNFDRWIALAINVAFLLGIIFVGTGVM